MLLVAAGCSAAGLGAGASGGIGGGRSDFGGPTTTGPADLSPPGDGAPPDLGGAGDGGSADDGGGAVDGGSGLYGGPLQQLMVPQDWQAHGIVVADVTGDGRADIVVAAQSNGTVSGGAIIVFAQLGGGAFATPAVYSLGTDVFPAMLVADDFDHDGRIDVAVTTGQNVPVVLLQTFAGTLGTPRALTPTRADDAELVAAGDFDGDGRADLVVAGYGAAGADVWYQADGLTAAHNVACDHVGPNAIAVGDFDGDGATDVALTSYDSGALCVFLQRTGALTDAVVTPEPEDPPPEFLAAGDVDGDGRTDLVFTSGLKKAGQYLAVLHGNGDGSFTLAATLDTDYWPNGALVADVDGDGRSDVIVPHFDMLAVGIYRQRADGSLAPEEEYPYTTSQLSSSAEQLTAVGDVDGDGKPDIVSVADLVTILHHR